MRKGGRPSHLVDLKTIPSRLSGRSLHITGADTVARPMQNNLRLCRDVDAGLKSDRECSSSSGRSPHVFDSA